MATIYRFIVENGGTGGSSGKSGTGSSKSKGVKKGYSTKKGKARTGVEFTRYQRITTTFGNKATNGMYSPVLRTAKAVGSIASSLESGNAVSGVAIVIIIQTILRIAERILNIEQHYAEMANTADMRKLEVGATGVSKEYNISKNLLTGRINLNEN